MESLVHRVVWRFVVASTNLRELEITSQNLESVLNGLIADVHDLEGVGSRLGVDLQNMTSIMQKIHHSDDLHHNGETILTHIGWVLDDVDRLTQTMDAEKRALLRLTALCHDLGKAYTHNFDPTKQKHTFRGHADKSVEIAKVLLEKHRQELGDLYDKVLDLVRLHDVFFSLVEARSKQPQGSTKYVSGLMQENIYRQGLLRDLLTFAKADAARSKSYDNKIKNFEGVVEDVERAETEMETAAREAEVARTRQERKIEEHMPKIRALLEQNFPEAAAVLPNLRETKRLLGQAKRYDLIKEIQDLVSV
jgi:putative nucleotidyltransferase with HDIG domain